MVTAREMSMKDAEHIVDYFLDASNDFIRSLGADPTKFPEKKRWLEILGQEFNLEPKLKECYYTIWELEGQAIGHCNVNKIEYGKKAFMHLHLWSKDNRLKGMGTQLVKKSIPYFFNTLQLENLICEPFAKNKAPNKTLLKVGFEFVKNYETKPGWINFFQEVSRYEMSRAQFNKL